mmetsp:Transcript_55254/g.103595  ORF Transcript_55254/g.103595 Transcript_55254/m.103595 type:complete len:203 (+) Transcript_55254:279-887(+)
MQEKQGDRNRLGRHLLRVDGFCQAGQPCLQTSCRSRQSTVPGKRSLLEDFRIEVFLHEILQSVVQITSQLLEPPRCLPLKALRRQGANPTIGAGSPQLLSQRREIQPTLDDIPSVASLFHVFFHVESYVGHEKLLIPSCLAHGSVPVNGQVGCLLAALAVQAPLSCSLPCLYGYLAIPFGPCDLLDCVSTLHRLLLHKLPLR